MSLRSLPAVVVGALLTLGSCGGGDLTSDSPDEVIERWVDLVCADDPVESDDAPRDDDAVRYLECTPTATRDIRDDITASLTVFADAESTTAAADDEVLAGECDIPYAVIAGPRWISRLDDGWGSDALIEAGGEVICEGL